MKSLADNLPADIARSVHPDWRKNEADYWAARDQLLAQYHDRWIAFADGIVIASGSSPVSVLETARKVNEHPFLICVGREDEPSRMRRASARSNLPAFLSLPGQVELPGRLGTGKLLARRVDA
jgi:hypothetical protein